jgi:hypothetical protein
VRDGWLHQPNLCWVLRVQVKVCSRKASALEAAGDVAGAVQLYLVCLECAKVGCALGIYVFQGEP